MDYKISIPSTSRSVDRGSFNTTVVIYNVEIRQDNDKKWTVKKRYNDFHLLHTTLLHKHSPLELIEFPPKKLFGTSDPAFVEERRAKLEDYMTKVISIIPKDDPILCKFLHLKEPDITEEEQEKSMERLSDNFEIVRQVSFDDGRSPQSSPQGSLAQIPPSKGIDRVRALYDFKSDVPTDLNFKAGDAIFVLNSRGTWWSGTCNGKTGDFPSNLVGLDPPSEASYIIEILEDFAQAVVMHDWKPNPEEYPQHYGFMLNLKFGDIVKLYRIEQYEAGDWWLGTVSGSVVGYFPKYFVRRLGEQDFISTEVGKKVPKSDVALNYRFDPSEKTYVFFKSAENYLPDHIEVSTENNNNTSLPTEKSKSLTSDAKNNTLTLPEKNNVFSHKRRNVILPSTQNSNLSKEKSTPSTPMEKNNVSTPVPIDNVATSEKNSPTLERSVMETEISETNTKDLIKPPSGELLAPATSDDNLSEISSTSSEQGPSTEDNNSITSVNSNPIISPIKNRFPSENLDRNSIAFSTASAPDIRSHWSIGLGSDRQKHRLRPVSSSVIDPMIVRQGALGQYEDSGEPRSFRRPIRKAPPPPPKVPQ